MDSTLPHLNDSGGTLIGPLMDARWSVLRRQLPEKQAGAIYTLSGNTFLSFCARVAAIFFLGFLRYLGRISGF